MKEAALILKRLENDEYKDNFAFLSEAHLIYFTPGYRENIMFTTKLGELVCSI